MSSDPFFDKESFNNLIQGDRDLFVSLLDLFNEEAPYLFSEIEAGLAGQDHDRLEKALHRLKGSFKNFYCPEGAGLVAQVEDEVKLGHLDVAGESFPRIKTIGSRLKVELEAYLKTF